MNDEDKNIFNKAMAGIKRLNTSNHVPKVKPKLKPRAKFARADEVAALQESLEDDIDILAHNNGEAINFFRPHVGRRTIRKLKKGGFSIQAEIDLHGMTLAEAKPRLRRFIKNNIDINRLCVRVIHGKGLGSGERGPVLKNAVNSWLRRWNEVLAFVSTKQTDGGTGAIYVLLEKNKHGP